MFLNSNIPWLSLSNNLSHLFAFWGISILKLSNFLLLLSLVAFDNCYIAIILGPPTYLTYFMSNFNLIPFSCTLVLLLVNFTLILLKTHSLVASKKSWLGFFSPFVWKCHKDGDIQNTIIRWDYHSNCLSLFWIVQWLQISHILLCDFCCRCLWVIRELRNPCSINKLSVHPSALCSISHFYFVLHLPSVNPQRSVLDYYLLTCCHLLSSCRHLPIKRHVTNFITGSNIHDRQYSQKYHSNNLWYQMDPRFIMVITFQSM